MLYINERYTYEFWNWQNLYRYPLIRDKDIYLIFDKNSLEYISVLAPLGSITSEELHTVFELKINDLLNKGLLVKKKIKRTKRVMKNECRRNSRIFKTPYTNYYSR